MQKLLAISLIAIFLIGMLTSIPFQHAFGVSKTQKKIDKLIASKLPNKDWTKIQGLNMTITSAPRDVIKVYNKTGTTPNPNPPPTGSCAIPDVNHSKFLRVGVTGDTKTGGKEFQVMHDCHVDVNVVAGDLWYTSTCNDWLAAVEKLGWTKNNTDLAVGNHDSDGSCIRDWLGQTSTYHQVFFHGADLAITTINGNSDIKCDGAQFAALKPRIVSSDAMYNFVQIHQPFLTVKNNHHGPNGEFSCWHALFRSNGIDMVLQAHVHNYQRFMVDGIAYTVGPPGTHDTGSGLYTQDTKVDQLGNKCVACVIDNGVMLLDLQIADPHVHQIIGNTINLKGQILDHFVLAR